jgi:hypothetical protein
MIIENMYLGLLASHFIGLQLCTSSHDGRIDESILKFALRVC